MGYTHQVLPYSSIGVHAVSMTFSLRVTLIFMGSPLSCDLAIYSSVYTENPFCYTISAFSILGNARFSWRLAAFEWATRERDILHRKTGMERATWRMARFLAVWYPWIVLVLLVYLVFMVSALQAQVAALRGGGAGAGPRNRQELEEAYKAGTIGRDQYERLKARMS